jgi:hypothetical protein
MNLLKLRRKGPALTDLRKMKPMVEAAGDSGGIFLGVARAKRNVPYYF